MASMVQDDTSRLRGFASLAWLDNIISFVFRLLAKLAEPFLAFGLIASAIDYGSHGQFLAHRMLFAGWVVTQSLALEGSGGVALSMSFEARKEHDQVKARIQCALAMALLIAGGIMFYVELCASIRGFRESAMPDWYVYGMCALRTLVSVGYIAMCRTAHHRFSGNGAQDTSPAPQPIDLSAQIREAVRNEVQAIAQLLKSEVSTSVQVLVQNAQMAQPAQAPVVRAAETVINEDIAEQTMLALAATPHTAHIEPVLAAVYTREAQGSDARSRVFAFLTAHYEEHGASAKITNEMIMAGAQVAKNTASAYRREYNEQKA